MSYYDEDDDFDIDDIWPDWTEPEYNYEDDVFEDNLIRCQCCEVIVDKLIPFNGNKMCVECVDDSKAEANYADHHMRSKQDLWDD